MAYSSRYGSTEHPSGVKNGFLDLNFAKNISVLDRHGNVLELEHPLGTTMHILNSFDPVLAVKKTTTATRFFNGLFH
ncbi:unnamed protein product [Sphenostylis stenocarpa]|uniref:Uncharacterized protein n=1 Tax=Sphenostylis stenocarpa TaxID=92480 RepID=A0AA86VFJ3_9FABA|nr:unnamed protein product [Sphenostylis stenocarpa]